ncbi:MAG TPA: hypothetical protein VK449_04740, partial [Anaerolineales bacterium]|nr:hypothetical protein [Anaerolineales bacterium]
MIVTVAAMTGSLVGQAGPDKRTAHGNAAIAGGQARTASQPAANRNDPTQPSRPPRRSEAGLTGYILTGILYLFLWLILTLAFGLVARGCGAGERAVAITAGITCAAALMNALPWADLVREG